MTRKRAKIGFLSAVFLACLGRSTVGLDAQPAKELLVFTQVGSGQFEKTAFRTVFRVRNEGSVSSAGEFQYFNHEGAPIQPDSEAKWVGETGTIVENESRLAFTIPPTSSLVLSLVPTRTPVIGWARLYKDPAIEAGAFFQYARMDPNAEPNGFEDSIEHEAETYPMHEMKDLSFPVSLFQGSQEINTAFALVNLSARPASVALTLRPNHVREVTIDPGHLLSTYFTEFWEVAFPAVFPLEVEMAAEAHSEAPFGVVIFRTLNGVPMSGVQATHLVGADRNVPAELGTEFELPYGATAVIASENLEVTFWNIPEDSRCPTNVVCIWEGQARVVLRVRQTGEPLGELELIDRAGNEELATGELGGYVFRLSGVEPYPTAEEKIELKDYRLRLTVERKAVEKKMGAAS